MAFKSKISTEYHQSIIDDYNNGKRAVKLAKEFKVTTKVILRILRNYNVKLRNIYERGRLYKHNEYFFKDIDSEEKAYFLGLMISDGNNDNKSLRINLTDREILDKFKECLEYTGPIIKSIDKRKDTYKPIYSLNVRSKNLTDDLTKHGCIKAKSYFTYFPEISENLKHHFIRGIFDGDGCIHKDKLNNLRFAIIGNKELIESIQNIFINLGLNKTKLQHKEEHNNKIVSVTYNGNLSCKKLYDYMYKDSTIYLERKKKIFENVV